MTVFLAEADDGEAAGLGAYIPIEDLPGLSFTDSATQIMLQRYQTDHQVGVFGLYLGDEAEGEVHSFGG